MGNEFDPKDFPLVENQDAHKLMQRARVEKITTASNVEIKACKNLKCVNLARAYNKLAIAYADLASGRKP